MKDLQLFKLTRHDQCTLCGVKQSETEKLRELVAVCKDLIEHGYHRSRLIEAVDAVEPDLKASDRGRD